MKRLRLFLDSNVIISGLFFSGPESALLKQHELDFITSDVNYNEILDVVKRKFKSLNISVLKYALEKIDEAFIDIDIVYERDWKTTLDIAAKYLKGNDQKILAAGLYAKPDYFVTGDRDFHRNEIKNLVNTINTRMLMKKLKILE